MNPPAARQPRRDDGGSAVVEFVVLICVLLLPVVYLITVMARVQAATFATQTAARAASVMIAQAPDAVTAASRSNAAVAAAMSDQGFPDTGDPAPQVEVSCSGSECQRPGTQVRVIVSQEVSFPVPRFLAGVIPLHVTVSSAETAVSDRFRA